MSDSYFDRDLQERSDAARYSYDEQEQEERCDKCDAKLKGNRHCPNGCDA